MTDVTITRKTTVKVDEVGENDFGDLTFSDTKGGRYKIKDTRKSYFTDVIKVGRRVQLNWAEYKGNEYVYSAVAVEDNPPVALKTALVAKPDVVKPVVGTGESDKEGMTKGDWEEKDRKTRKSIERQVALGEAVKLVIANIIATTELIPYAKRFEAYFAGNMATVDNTVKEVLPAKSKVVEEAKKLGATEIKKGEGTVTDP